MRLMKRDDPQSLPVLDYEVPHKTAKPKEQATHKQQCIVAFSLTAIILCGQLYRPSLNTIQDVISFVSIPFLTAWGLYHWRKHREGL
jgi:hypothetical protein